MQVKKFEAPTIAEALKLVKTELGPDAIILSTKNHRKGFGLLSKASIEVTAAVADKTLAKKQITEKLVPPSAKEQISKLSAQKQSQIYGNFSDYVDRRRSERMGFRTDPEDPRRAQKTQANRVGPPRYASDAAAAQADSPMSSGAQGYGRNGRLESKIHEGIADLYDGYESVGKGYSPNPQEAAPKAAMEGLWEAGDTGLAGLPRESIASLQEDIRKLKTMMEELKSDQAMLSDTKMAESSTDELQVEFNNLLRNGVEKKYAAALIKQVSFSLPREQQKSPERVIETLAVEMMNNLKTEPVLDLKPNGQQRVYALVGPTGVGKTTTIAKLASQAILQKNLRVGLINVDSYKVAALDQLATYAKILNVPFRQATNAAELDRALTEFKPLDLILIDTSGRSQRDSESLMQMKSLLSECAAVRPLLIMSATTRDQELCDIITRFKLFNPSGLIFSKLDETTTFGCIYNISQKTGLPLAYFTVGQRVPEDIEPASRERVADLILDL